MSAGKDKKAQIRRRKIMELFNAGYSLSKISKETGISYKHVNQIVNQANSLNLGRWEK